MAFRQLELSRTEVMRAYYREDGTTRTLRQASAILGVSPNTVRRWLIWLDLYPKEKKQTLWKKKRKRY